MKIAVFLSLILSFSLFAYDELYEEMDFIEENYEMVEPEFPIEQEEGLTLDDVEFAENTELMDLEGEYLDEVDTKQSAGRRLRSRKD
jgi:hypothetical protein